MTEVLLLHPPFARWDRPPLGIAVLGAFLQQRGISVAAIDTNLAFAQHMPTADDVASGLEFAWERFQELDRQSELEFRHCVEYMRLLRAVRVEKTQRQAFKKLFAAPGPSLDRRDILLRRLAAMIACTKHFPEAIDADTYLTDVSAYSVQHLLQAIRTGGGIVAPFLAELLKTEATRLRSSGGCDPIVVGISCILPNQALPAFHLARAAKRIFPRSLVVLGGAFVSTTYHALDDPALFDHVDALVLGEGEKPLAGLVQVLRRTLPRQQPEIGSVPGLLYRDQNLVRRTARPMGPDLPQAPPAFHLFDLDLYPGGRRSIKLPFALSRGCSWGRCSFCRDQRLLSRLPVQPPGELLRDHLRTTLHATGVEELHFVDDCASPLALEQIALLLAAEFPGTSWMANTRFSPKLTEQRCQILRQGGCRYLILGLEAYNDELLRRYRKGISVRLINRTLGHLRAAGIPARVNMIVGLPGETVTEALAAHQALQRLLAEGLIQAITYSPFQLLPDSEVGRDPCRFGIRSASVLPEDLPTTPITVFDAPGMTRNEAAALAARFSHQEGQCPYLPLGPWARSRSPVHWNGRTLIPGQDLDQLADLLIQASSAQVDYSHWLRANGHLRYIREADQPPDPFFPKHSAQRPGTHAPNGPTIPEQP